MLQELGIRNFALLEDVRVPFGPGFNVLTGETGAGKSILIDAIGRVLGGRASPEDIRTGAEHARIEAVFDLPQRATAPALHALLEEIGLLGSAAGEAERDAEALILSRDLSRTGRSIARINGRAVPVTVQAQVGQHLVDVHGQHEHFSLLRPEVQLDLLDRFGGLLPLRDQVAAVVRELRSGRSVLKQLRVDERELARRVDLLHFQVEEIRAARLQPGEDAELDRERLLLMNAERLAQLSGQLYALLAGGSDEQRSALDLLGMAARELASLAQIDAVATEQERALAEAVAQVEEVARYFRAYLEGVEFDPQRLAAIEDRVDLLRNLKRKYGDTLAAVVAFGEQAAAELEQLANREQRAAELEAREVELVAEAAGRATQLSLARRAAGDRLATLVQRQLADLNLKAAFEVALLQVPDSDGLPLTEQCHGSTLMGAKVQPPAPSAQHGSPNAGATAPYHGTTARTAPGVRFDESGIDQVEFRIAPNPGEPLKPVARIASGGELSRILLALKSILSDVDYAPTLIFDEIDVGIGGRGAEVVAEKLYRIAARHQVLCVTHLPQIAAFGDRHYFIAKQERDGRTVTEVRPLSDPERVEELAQMLGGSTMAALSRANELLSRARKGNTKG